MDSVFRWEQWARFARRCAILSVLMAAVAVPAACQAREAKNVTDLPPVNVWATGDCVRVNPVTGKYFIDRPDIHPDYPTGDYRSHNAVWDAARKTVTLRAARNEFVAFQVIVESHKPVSGVKVRLDKLIGPRGAAIGGRNVALFKAWYVEVKQRSSVFDKLGLGLGWYPDALIPIKIGAPAAFDIPDARNKIGPKQKNQTIWVDVYVPRDRAAAPPGTYRGEVHVTGGVTSTLIVSLDVWDFALPDERHLRGDIWNSSLARMPPDLELAYYQMFHRHRFQPGVCYHRPKLKLAGAKVTIDWTDYDARLTKYVDGSAFTKTHGYWGPGEGVPITHIILPPNCGRGAGGGWPVPLPKGKLTPEYEAAWRDFLRQAKEHYDAHPAWKKIGKVVFMGSLDEGYNMRVYKRMMYYSTLCSSAAGKGWYQFRVDGGHNFATMKMLRPYVDLWVMATFSHNGDKMTHYRKLGLEGWFYGDMIFEKASALSGSNTYLDLDLLTCRGPGWAAWWHRSGFCSWEFDYHSWSAWTVAANFRHRRTSRHAKKGSVFNGSGLLIYPGKFIGSKDPVPSIRFKAHRRGFQDYEYFWLLSQRDGKKDAADKLCKSIIHSHPFGNPSHRKIEIWKNNPEAWDAVRIQMGNRLSAGKTR